MKRTDAKELFSSVWNDDEVIILSWEKDTIEEHLGRKVSASEWSDVVAEWEKGGVVDRISEEVSDAIIDLIEY